MATSSQVKTGLDAIAQAIAAQRAVMEKTKSNAAGASAVLAALATDFADVVATIQGYGTTNDFEKVAKAELAKLSAEYTALKVHADAVAAVDLDS